MSILSEIKGILFDLDGVLFTGSKPIDGAVEAVSRIRANGMLCRFVTNTSTLSLASLHHKIKTLGFSIPINEIISAPQATLLYLRHQQNKVCRILLAEDIKKDFQEFSQSDISPDYIVIGDIGKAWSYQLLNEVFNNLMDGAKLIAIHKNKFWQTEEGLQMDIGGFINGLEYASGTKSIIMGKPSKDFFQIAMNDMSLGADNLAIIGDDIDADIDGGQEAGLTGILVKTGKYRESYVNASNIKPKLIINSIADLPQVFGF